MTTDSSIRHTVVFRQGEDGYHTYRIRHCSLIIIDGQGIITHNRL